MKKAIFILAVLLHASLMPLCAQCLTLEVYGINQSQGYLYVTIYDSKDNFMKAPIAAFRAEVKADTLRIPCQGLPPGEYALSLYQDVNGNGRLDTGTFGIPQEPYGFSNNAKGVMGPPSYKQCLFTLREDTVMEIELQ